MLVDHCETARQIGIAQQRQRSLNRLTDSVLRRWMNFHSDNAKRALRRKSDYISKVRVQCHDYSAIVYSEAQYLFVCGSCEPDLHRCASVMTVEP